MAESGLARADGEEPPSDAAAASKWTVAALAAPAAAEAAVPPLSARQRNAFNVFIPEDLPHGLRSAAGKTLAGMTDDELLRYRRGRHSCYRDFARFVFEEVLGCGAAALALVPAAQLD